MAGFFDFLFSTKRADAQPQQYLSTPSPVEMVNTEQADKKYRGRGVAWDVTIQTMYNDLNPNEIVVQTHFGGSAAISVWLILQVGANPEIYDCGSGRRIHVRGNIKSIQNNEIYLDQCLLTI